MEKQIDLWLSNDEVLEQLGLRIKELRLKSNLGQKELAKEIAVSGRTLRRLESGEGASMETFINIVRFFSEMDKLDAFFKFEDISPQELFEARDSHKRKRASS